MSVSRDYPNPLRPYYKPPSIGLPQPAQNSSHSIAIKSSPPNSSFATSAREIFNDLKYTDYVSDSGEQTLSELLRGFLDQGLLKYTSVMLAQPFDVAKTILQCQLVEDTQNTSPTPAEGAQSRDSKGHTSSEYENYISDESDSSETSYFAATSSMARSRHQRATRRRAPPIKSQPPPDPQILVLAKPGSVLEVISQVWQKEGVWGIWKGANATFIHSVMLKTLESWIANLIAAILNVPDPSLATIAGIGGADGILESSNPWISLGIAVAAAGSAGLILAPLDIVRTRLILTPTSRPHRGILRSLRQLPSFFCPPELISTTLLHSTIPAFLATSTPILLRSKLHVDPVLTPTTYSVLLFLSSSIELFIKLPLETVLRRGQIHNAARPNPPSALTEKTIIRTGPYLGTFRTMWEIVKNEGTTYEKEAVSTAKPHSLQSISKVQRGQGVGGLWRGWRVGVWGLIGMWGATSLGAGAKGGEF
ncbi:MAG: mitochondrial fusion and transport protein ugo1 [Trizodia sp. TS-e1964]|nr:MAG: mitochondrial fusion and transport protein ugo1 [Trizodia sp. TS-e1964]